MTLARRKITGDPRPTVQCNYCGRSARLVCGPELYPHRPDLAHVRAWRCDPCDAQVGCHDGTTRPKGTLAKRALKAARQRAHAAFDPLWKCWQSAYGKSQGAPEKVLRRIARDRAYQWLAHAFGTDKEVHIGEMDETQCAKVLAIIAEHRPTAATIRTWAKSRDMPRSTWSEGK